MKGSVKETVFRKTAINAINVKRCNKKQQRQYDYKAYDPDIKQSIILYAKEGVGIRSTARILKISTTTLLNRIVLITKMIDQPAINKNQIYEVDEIKSL